MENLIEKIDELRANSVTEEQFQKMWGMSTEEYVQKMMEAVEALKKKTEYNMGYEQCKKDMRFKIDKALEHLCCHLPDFVDSEWVVRIFKEHTGLKFD